MVMQTSQKVSSFPYRLILTISIQQEKEDIC